MRCRNVLATTLLTVVAGCSSSTADGSPGSGAPGSPSGAPGSAGGTAITVLAGPAPRLTIPTPSIPSRGATIIGSPCTGFTVSLSSELLFARGSAELPADAEEILRPIAAAAVAGKAHATVQAFASAEGRTTANEELIRARTDALVERLRRLGLTELSSRPGAILGRPDEPAAALAGHRKVTITLEPGPGPCAA